MPILERNRRRLQQGRRSTARPSTGPSTGRASNASRGTLELPPILPPACPLDDGAIRELHILSQNRAMSKLEAQIKKSLDNIASASYSLNLEVRTSRESAQNMPEKKSKEKEKMMAQLAQLDEQIEELSKQSEQGTRELIDLKAELADEKLCVLTVYQRADAAGRNRTAEEQRIQEALERAGLDGDQAKGGILDEDVESTLGTLKEMMAQKAAEYDQYSAQQKYATNNDYISWKKQWHDGRHGEEVILQNSRTWFTQDGRPVFHFGEDETRQMDEDEDLVVEREVVSSRCPLSLVEMKEPYTATACKHTFEKSVIIEFFQGQPSVRCPVSGCDKRINRQDLFFDKPLLRKFERQRREEQGGQDSSNDEDEYDEGGDEELRISRETRRRSRNVKQEVMQVDEENGEDEDGEKDDDEME